MSTGPAKIVKDALRALIHVREALVEGGVYEDVDAAFSALSQLEVEAGVDVTDDLRAQLRAEEDEHGKTKAELEGVKQKLKEAEERVKELEDERDSLEDDVSDLTSERDHLQEQVNDRRALVVWALEAGAHPGDIPAGVDGDSRQLVQDVVHSRGGLACSNFQIKGTLDFCANCHKGYREHARELV